MKKSSRLNINDIKDPKLRQQILSQINGDRSTHPASNMESNTGDEPKRPNGAQKDGEICRVYVHSIRKKLADSDGISGKAMLDGIVDSGLLIDDSPEEVEFVRHTQEKTKEEEMTVIRVDFYG